MASTTASWNKGDTQPSLAAMAVNDTKTITGKKATAASMRKITASRQGKTFDFRSTRPSQYIVTRIA
jgi:hypothetical protein